MTAMGAVAGIAGIGTAGTARLWLAQDHDAPPGQPGGVLPSGSAQGAQGVEDDGDIDGLLQQGTLHGGQVAQGGGEHGGQ